MGIIKTYRLLAWKYYNYRKFYWTGTVIEFFLPLIIVYITITIASRIIGRTSTRAPEYSPPQVTIKHVVQRINYDVIVYTPGSILVNEHMETTKRIYNDVIPGEIFPNITHVTDETELVAKISKSDQYIVGVVYMNYIKGERFTYKIRDKERWNTTSLFVPSETVHNGPYFPDPYYKSGFAGLQYCLDRAFLYLLDANESRASDNASFESFPYPSYIAFNQLRFLVPLVIALTVVISSLIILVPLTLTMIHERSSGLTEVMKLAGLRDELNWLCWFINTFLFGLVVLSLITFILLYDPNGHEYASIRVVEMSLLWTIIIMYFFAQISFCFVFCVIFNSALLGITSLVVITLSMAYGAFKVHDYNNFILVHLSCFCPAGALVQAFERIKYYEILELPVTWQYVFKKELTSTEASLGYVLTMFVVDSIIYLTLTWYIDAINPGKYGYKKSPLFFIKRKKSNVPTTDRKKNDDDDDEDDDGMRDPFVESVDVESEIGLEVRDLKKKYGVVEAVKGVNMTMLKNEIYVILGSDKSGKSTILSMIAGTIEPTEGQVLYRGSVDLLRNFKEYKGMLGYCPQDHRLFPYFTIIDHMMFYGMLKGGKKDYIEEQATQYLQWMGLYENADDLAAVVSVEMKRKLGISIGLIGNAEILVIDEPTAGLEPIAKRKIWNLLSELKYDRTIVMASSNAQEAGVIGDRIAMLNSGVVVCEGSVEFLNKTFATGYELNIKKKDENFVPSSSEKDPIQGIIKLVHSYIPKAKAIIKSSTETVFNLPDDSSKFPALFKSLEAKKRSLNIGRIGVSSSTLEKVFLKIGGESIYDAEGNPLKLDSLIEEAFKTKIREEEKLSGIPLIMQQHKALFSKKNTFAYRTWYVFLYRAFIPTVFMTILLYGTVKFDVIDPPILLSIETYKLAIIELKNDTISDQSFKKAFHTFLSAKKIKSKEIGGTTLREVLLRLAFDNLAFYRREAVLAVQFNKSDNENWPVISSIAYNKFARHSLPLGVNILTNTVLANIKGPNALYVETYNHPIKSVNVSREQDKFNTDLTETSPVITVWYLVIAFFTIDLLDFISSPAIAERIDGFKHVQFLSSVSPLTYWTNTFIFDFIYFFGIVALRMLLFQILDVYNFFAIHLDFIVVVLLLVLFIASGLLFMYLCSFILTTRYGAYAFFTLFNIFCTVVTLSFYKLQESLFKANSPLYETIFLYIARYLILSIPPLNFNLAIQKYLTTWRVNHLIEAYVKIESRNSKRISKKDHSSGNVNYTRYLEFASKQNPNGILGEVLFLVFDIIFYALIIINVEFGYVYTFVNRVFHSTGVGKKTKKKKLPSDIKEEVKRVDSAVKSKKSATNIYFIAQHLRKVYQPLIPVLYKQKVAVNDVSFTVKSGECFGIVGPNDSGKTVTFKMMAGEVIPTKGDSWILGSKLSFNKTEYYSKAGYCSQKDSFLEELTGREILSLVASLRGILPRHRQDTIERWVTILGLKSVITKKCSSYDEGNRRKICAALALIGEPEVVLLDEPTTRIDPVSRRSLYSAFSQIKSEGRAAVISFRSIQECGNLCDRFTLIIKGQMKFIGTADEMINKFGVGFTLLIFVKGPEKEDSADSRVDDILQLKIALVDKFKNKKLILLAESKGAVIYDVKTDMKWSDVFKRMEALKKSLKFIEDYQVSDKSLDEIFTALVKGKFKS